MNISYVVRKARGTIKDSIGITQVVESLEDILKEQAREEQIATLAGKFAKAGTGLKKGMVAAKEAIAKAKTRAISTGSSDTKKTPVI